METNTILYNGSETKKHKRRAREKGGRQK